MARLDILTSTILLVLTAAIGLTYLVRIQRKGRAIYERVERQGGSLLLSKRLMEMGYWAMLPFCHAATHVGISANLISFAALIFGAVTGVCIALGHFGLAAFFGLLGGALDGLDGMVARATGTMSYAGKVLDSALDRYVEFLMFAGLLVYYQHILWIQALVFLAMLGSFMVSYSTALAEITQVQLPRGSMQRPERLVYLILGATLTPFSQAYLETLSHASVSLAYPIVFSVTLIAWVANFSAVSRIRYIRRAIDTREQKVISLTLAQVRNVRSHK